MINKRIIGSLGEEKAIVYLKNSGYKILEQNYRSIFGEIDIIAKNEKDLVFIEVKLRTSDAFGLPAEAITVRKQERIIKSALQYVKAKSLTADNLRFDVLLIGPQEDKIELIKAAFVSDGFYIY